ncbi:MAG: hypothetical protein HKL90_01300 [Elusimicrobia bacterium]|nr:hypothetical protein [Elusimicrobiota bacterium]
MNEGLRPRLFMRSLLLQAGFGDERRQGLGFSWTIDPALRAAYRGDADGLRAARRRHLESFNTQPCAAGLIVGACAALEARAAAGDAGAAERARAFKSSIGAALAGSADALFWGALRPLAAATAALVAVLGYRAGAASPFMIGAASGLLVFNAPALTARWLGVGRGLAVADAAALEACSLPAQSWIRVARWTALALALVACALALELPELRAHAALAAAALAFGAAFSRAAGGPLRLVAAAGILGAAASLALGWAP